MVVVEVVDTLSVDASAVVPLIETEAGLRTHVAGLVAFEGALTAQVSATVPVNEFDGVTVTVTVLPVVAPGLTVMLPPFESEKLAVPLVPPPPQGMSVILPNEYQWPREPPNWIQLRMFATAH